MLHIALLARILTKEAQQVHKKTPEGIDSELADILSVLSGSEGVARSFVATHYCLLGRNAEF